MTAAVTAYIGLGSNLDNPESQVRRACDELAQLQDSRLMTVSPLYRSDPVGPPGQPDYINAVVGLATALPPEALLDALQSIEQAHGRERREHWGARTLDLDILLYGDRIIASARLTVPHPYLAERPFVLYPLADVAPAIKVPGRGPLATLLAGCPPAGVERLDGQ
jgi:2-amino-4-hydroxy-6-hydroxymethyldihydropteridine diphosphokinase